MIGKLLDKLTYANVVATIALFGVLGGGAYAAFRVPPNSVGSRQLKAKAVTGGKIANGTISGGKLEPETITGANIKMSALGTVPRPPAPPTPTTPTPSAATPPPARQAQP